MSGQELRDAGLVLDVALGMVAGASSVSADAWQEFCGEKAGRLRSAYEDMVEAARGINNGQAVDMDMLRSLCVESTLWDALGSVSSGEDALGACLDALGGVSSSSQGSHVFHRPCGEVLDAARDMSPSECLRAAHAEWDAEAVCLARGDVEEAQRAVVRSFLYESAAAGCVAEGVLVEDIVDEVAEGAALAVEDWVESGRVSSCPGCSVCPAGCASCLRAWLS